MAKDFFDVVNSFDPTKEVIDLAMKKFQMDTEKAKFNLLMSEAEKKQKSELDQLTSHNNFKNYMTEQIANSKGSPAVFGMDSEQAQGGLDAITQPEIAGKPMPSAKELILKGIEMGAIGPEKALEGLLTAEKKIPDDFKFIGNPKSGIAVANTKKGTVETVSEPQETAKNNKPYPSSVQDEAYRLIKEQFAKDKVEREPYASEISEMVTALTNTRKTAEYKAMKDVKDEGGFASWKPEAKHNTFMLHAITGDTPVNVKGLAGTDRQVYGKEFAQWQVDQGLRPQDIMAMRTDYKAGDITLKNMAKQEAPMNAFVLNINKQVDKLQSLFADAERSGLRLADVPLRDLRVKAKGSGKEAVLASYLLEVSNEIGKLSSGASASVQQLSDSAKEDWKKVHDVNLSMKEIMYVLNATKDQANMRIGTWREARKAVRNELKAIGITEGETPSTNTGPSKFKILKVE